MELPTIRVEDADNTTLILALRYICGENELDLKAIYANIYSLLDHPGRACLDRGRKPVTCSEDFLEVFWSAAASLLDYFADFYATDTALMQSIWFHLLDTWRKARPIPLFHIDHAYHYTSLAQRFEQDYNDTSDLIHKLILSKPRTQSKNHGDAIIHCPSGKVVGLGGRYETGPFISGLKPWQQFLYAGAPGFTPFSAEDDNSKPGNADKDTTTRYVPQPAIALIQTYTARARALATKVAEMEAYDLSETLAAFDANALPTPSSIGRGFTHPSFTHPGKVMSYQLVQGAPPVTRHEGLTDPSMLIDDPDFVLLDEAVGTCKGREAYVPMTGPIGEDGAGFDVWAVTAREDGLGWESGARSDEKSVFANAAGEMFDDWQFEDEDE